VYAIKSEKNNDLYIGYTEDVEIRVKTHNQGKVRSTKVNMPWTLLYYEAYLDKNKARKREYQLKQSYFKKELKERIINSIEESSE
jgi:putative endonuclease